MMKRAIVSNGEITVRELTQAEKNARAQWTDTEADKQRQRERQRIGELRASILDQIAMGETPDPDKRAEYKRLRQKHPRIAGEESAPLSDGAFTR